MKRLWAAAALAVALTLALAGCALAYPAGWTSDRTVTSGTGEVDVAVKGDTVHLVYENNGVYYRRSTDMGLTWGSAVRVDGGTGFRPRVTAGAGTMVYAAYVGRDRPGASGDELLVRRSTNGGQSWEQGHYARAGSPGDDVESVELTHGTDSVSLCWKLDVANRDYIYWSPLGGGGDLSAGRRQVWDASTEYMDRPRIAGDGTNVFVAYMGQDAVYHHWNIYCMRYDGTAASNDVIADDGTHTLLDPDVSCQGPGLFNVVWTDSYDGSSKVCRRTWNGTVWGGRSVLYDAGAQQPAPRAVPFSADSSVICREATGAFLAWAMLGSSADIMKGSAPASWAAGRAPGGEAVAAAGCADGKVRLKRTDSAPPSSSGVEVEGTRAGETTYAGAGFGVSFGAVADDWDLTGTDPDGDSFTNGVSSIQMKFSENLGGPWGNLPTDRGSILDNAPWSATADTSGIGDDLYYIKGILTDTAGNTGEVVSGPVVLDKTPPTCGISTDPPHHPDSWRTSPTTVTITAADANLDSIQYRVQPAGGAEAPWVPYSAPFRAPEGRNTIFYRATDKAGNSSHPGASLDVWVDTGLPECSVVFPLTRAYPPVDGTVINVKGNVEDEGVVASASIWIDGKQVYEVDDPRGPAIASPWNTDGKAPGPHTIEVKATDAAGHSSTSGITTFDLVENPAVDWYFAEGTTRRGFDTYICVLNPGDRDAALTFELMLETGEVVTKAAAVAKNSRATFAVRDMVEGEHDVSVRLRSDRQPVIAERPMYFEYGGGWTGGHTTPGSNALAKEYYFAEGTTRSAGAGGPFEEWLCVQNPGEKPAEVTVTYMPAEGENVVRRYRMGPHSRRTVDVNADVGPDRDVSVHVESDQPMAAERAIYFNYRGALDGGHVVTGAPSPSRTWYFAEGTTRDGFDEYITVQNPGDAPASLDLVFYLEDFSQERVSVSVPKRGRATWNVADFVGPGRDVSTKVTSDVPVIAERPMYFDYRGGWTGGHTCLGATELGRTFYLAEGTTRSGFHQWVTVFSSSDGAVAWITLIYPDGSRSDPMMYPVGRSRRTTIDINEAAGAGRDVSVRVTGDNDITVERPMYFDYGGFCDGGHVARGFKSN